MKSLHKDKRFWELIVLVLLICLIISFLYNEHGIILLLFSLFFIFQLYRRRHRLELENLANVDPITGGNTLQRFTKLAEEILTLENRKQYALVYTNFINFKVINEQLGHSTCDDILYALYESINDSLNDKEVVGRVTADNFCVLLEYENSEDLITRLDNWCSNTKQKVERHQWVIPEMEFGVYVIESKEVALPQMITRARIAPRAAVAIHSKRLRYAFYNDGMRLQLLREKQIEDMMGDALKKGEFQVYLQPKYNLADERMIGAEALTRWISQSEGMISPEEFIPLFERNGFIIQLDLWVFEEVCRMIRAWLDEGRDPIKISVNCSRTHFNNPGFFKEYVKIAKCYNVPENLIEIELTESLAVGDMDHFIQVIEEIRKAGFGCSVDDFGSGYSSLNMINAISVDTIKLDKVFFRNPTQDCERAEFVINSIISMAKVLSMKTVAEGVEDFEQVEMLKRLGCDYVQGYVFAKPMSIKDFEQYL